MYGITGALRGECQGGKFTLAANQLWIIHRHFCLSGCWNIETVSKPLHLQFVWRVDKKYVSKVCSCPGFQPVYAYRWLMVIMTQGRLSVQQRQRERGNLTAVWRFAGEREMFLWLWRAIRIYHFYFSHTHTHTHTRTHTHTHTHTHIHQCLVLWRGALRGTAWARCLNL